MGQAWRESASEERKPSETGGIQRQFPMLGVARKPVFLDSALIRSCADGRKAIGMCMEMSGYTDERLAELLGLSKGYVSKCLSGRGNFPAHLRNKLYEVCGNYAPLQYEAMHAGLELREQNREERIRFLEEELAKARAA